MGHMKTELSGSLNKNNTLIWKKQCRVRHYHKELVARAPSFADLIFAKKKRQVAELVPLPLSRLSLKMNLKILFPA